MRYIVFIPLIISTIISYAQVSEVLLPYGDMNQWQVRYIRESGILGGERKTLYAIAPTDTIYHNQAYVPCTGNPWGSSSTYAKCIVETAADGAVSPEKRGDGYCCRLENKLKHVELCDIYAMVTGTIFFGENLEPVGLAAKNKPYTAIDFGFPFNQHPMALKLDYKAKVEDSNVIISTRRNKIEFEEGRDMVGLLLLFQYRWEDPETGNIYAYRVGTASMRVSNDVPEWINNHIVPIRWGKTALSTTANEDTILAPQEHLNSSYMMTRNSKGKMVMIEEVGYSTIAPTHAVLMILSSWAGAFRAHEGNIFWVDNLRWVYDHSQ